MPLVSVVIPVYNEEAFIGPCIDSLLRQNIGADNIEILVVDGGSEDRTRDIVSRYRGKHSNVRLLDNPKRFTVFAFNIGITAAHFNSKYVAFLNCHAEYDADRFSQSIAYMEEYDADAVGGQSVAVARSGTLIGKSLAQVLRSWFSTGSRFRVAASKPEIADTASGTLYKKSLFDEIGLFNENLICSQDIELNKRLGAANHKLLYAPDLITHYKARSDLGAFVRHTFRNGIWAIVPFCFSSVIPVSLRHVVPLTGLLIFAFACVLVVLNIIPYQIVLIPVVLYTLVNLWVSFGIAKSKGDPNLALTLPWVFFVFHFSYAFGSLVGLGHVLTKCKFGRMLGLPAA